MQLMTAQGSTPLDPFARDVKLAAQGVSTPTLDALLALMRGLESRPSLWSVVLSTHQHQVGLNPPGRSGPNAVSVVAASDIHYMVDCAAPEGLTPWHYARVQVDAHSVDEAVELVAQAMAFSGCWDSAAGVPSQS